MTYCVGWKTKFGILIVADTVLSAAVPEAHKFPEIERTSFGELQGETTSKTSRYVAEEGLKIRVDERFVTGFSGDVHTAKNFLDSVADAFKSGFPLRDAISATLRNFGRNGSDTTILIGTYELNEPVLFQIEVSSGLVHEADGLVQIGSIPQEQIQWTEKMVDLTTERIITTPPGNEEEISQTFTQIIALLQSYGVHDYLLPHGIGGAFVGAWITSTGARWQGDNFFVVHHAQIDQGEIVMCAVMIRENSVCLIGNKAEMTKVLTTRKANSKVDALVQADFAIADYDRATFDYVISINSSKHIVIVVEMKKSRHHLLISLRPADIGTIGISWTEKLREITNTVAGVDEPDGQEMTLGFIPYMPISIENQVARDFFAEMAEENRISNPANY